MISTLHQKVFPGEFHGREPFFTSMKIKCTVPVLVINLFEPCFAPLSLSERRDGKITTLTIPGEIWEVLVTKPKSSPYKILYCQQARHGKQRKLLVTSEMLC
jgi:hypothetical protein